LYTEFDPLNISAYLPIKWLQEAEMYVELPLLSASSLIDPVRE